MVRRAFIVWFTGLSGSGKSTIAQGVRDGLVAPGRAVVVLDGDVIRERFHRHLGFSREDILENNRLITERCVELRAQQDVILVPIIAPYSAARAAARARLAPGFIEVHCDADLACVSRRDVKGLYARAASGELANLIGASPGSPYEPPVAPDLTLRTGTESVAQSVATLAAFVRDALGCSAVPRAHAARRPLFSVGTSRGGTTFFARMLSNHSEVRVASDPFLPLFRSFRTAVVRQTCNPSFDASQPLDDPYGTPERIAQMRAIQASTLDLPLPDGELDALRPLLASRMQLAASEVIPFLPELTGATYRDLLASGMDLLARAYRATDAAWVGFNDNWIVEFLPLLLRAFPDAKACILLRDPRGAMASSLRLRDRKPEKAHLVPLMFSFAHHWRKLAAFAWVLGRDPETSARVRVLRYEDLVTSPEDSAHGLAAFLDVPYDPAMLDTERFRPIAGDRWAGHSNFDVPSTGIYTDSVTAWQRALSDDAIACFEFLCGPEMALSGYAPVRCSDGVPTPGVRAFLEADDARALGWRNAYDAWDVELARDAARWDLLRRDSSTVSPDTAAIAYLFPDVLAACARVMRDRAPQPV